jgi:hypothetical protein
MPLALPELQAAFAAHLAGEHGPDLTGEILPAAGRLAIHRHHVRHSLAAALAATFPTVHAVVGADFFRGLARAFVGCSLPAQPVLSEYGAGFPDFVAGHEPARSLPYLADVARLDWALNLAFHAPADGRLTAAELAVLPAGRLPLLRLALSPGTTLLASGYPLDRIWAAAQPGASVGAVDLNSGGIHLLVLRRPDDAAFARLSAGEAAFVSGLGKGELLEEAAGTAGRADPEFDLSASFARLLGLGALAVAQ